MAFLTILTTAIVTTGAAQGAIAAKDRWIAKTEARFSALYLALFFEDYASLCSRWLAETEAHSASDGHDGYHHSGIPTLPDFPKEVDWRRIGIEITEDAFALRVSISAANSEIGELYDFEPPDGGDHLSLTETIAKGLEALALAERIRSHGRLKPASTRNPDYTVRRHLTERKAHWDEIRQRNLALQAEADEARRRLALRASSPHQPGDEL